MTKIFISPNLSVCSPLSAASEASAGVTTVTVKLRGVTRNSVIVDAAAPVTQDGILAYRLLCQQRGQPGGFSARAELEGPGRVAAAAAARPAASRCGPESRL